MSSIYQDWVGRTQEESDVVAAPPLKRLAAMLDHTEPPWRPDEVPPLGHWLYFLPHARESDIGPDGHPRRGGFLPPVELPRRMWAAGEFEFIAPIPVGAVIKRRSRIASVEYKAGRSGEMVFVRVEHEISAERTQAIREVHTIVYRDAPQSGEKPSPPIRSDRNPQFQRDIMPDPVLLFRYSALTFNGHRIHYDRLYCEKVEGYPGLVVHGPLTATLLMDLYLRQRPGAPVTAYSFRATRPLFDIHPFKVCGSHNASGAELWALDHEGFVAMIASLRTS